MKQHTSIEIAQELKRYRLEHDLTFVNLAKLVNEQFPKSAGIHASTLFRIEKGMVEPHERTVYKLKRALPGFLNDTAA